MSWEDGELTLEERARALLDAPGGRGVVKQLGKWLDDDARADLRSAVVLEGRRRGAPLDDDAASWPGKKLLRLARMREQGARERTNPIRRDEAFTCLHCGVHVPPHGRTARDHCPHCLRGRHVDVVPGDRAASCGGALDPVRYERRGDEIMLTWRCRSCGQERRNRALLDGDPADDLAAILAIGHGP